MRLVKTKGWVVTSDTTEYLDRRTFWSDLNAVTRKLFGVVLTKVTISSSAGSFKEEVTWLWGREDRMCLGEIPSCTTILNVVTRAISAIVHGVRRRNAR